MKEFFDFDIFKIEVSDKQRRLLEEPVNEDLIDVNKYANNSSYIPDTIYKRILNKMTDGKWSFVPFEKEIVEDGKNRYAQFTGMLIVPGFGIHTGIGTAPMNKKDNQNAMSSAKTYAFKNACKQMGLAPNVGDKDYDPEEPLFENELDLDDEIELEEEVKEKPKKKEKKESPKKAASLQERIKEVREAYEVEDDDDFVGFIQIWDEEILEIDDMDDEDWEDFLEHVENNKKKFEEY